LIFFSTLLHKSVYDIEGRRVGIVRDFSVSPRETFPIVTGLIVGSPLGNSHHDTIIPWSQVDQLEETPIHLSVRQSQIVSYTPAPDELLLARDILDKQIVDTQGFRVVKVNDLKLAQIKHTARLVGVDISFRGLLRRLGILEPFDLLTRPFPVKLSERTITWNYVEPIEMVRAGAATGQLALAGASVGATGVVPQVQLNVSHTRLADLRPADIADILEQLDAEEAGEMLERLDTETAADALNELEGSFQYELLSELDPERASDLLEILPPDDAADILADIPREEAERLLNLMPANESQPIRELLRYGAETAGGIMTTEVVSLAQDLTVEEALAYLRQHSNHLEMIYYLYIVDDEQHLVGVISLRQLVVAEPGTHLRDLMDPDVIKVTTDTDQEEVARVIARYDLLGVPVVDDENRLVGLITVDDAIDVIHEEQAEDVSEMAGTDVEADEEEKQGSWRAAFSRLRWLSVNAVAGLILAVILYRIFNLALAANIPFISTFGHITITIYKAFRSALQLSLALSSIFYLLPMLLLTSGSVGTQALSIAGWQLRSTQGRDFWSGLLRELRLGTLGGVLVMVVAGLFTWVVFQNTMLAVAIGLGFGVTLLVAAICGLALPTLFQRLRLRGSFVSAPLLDPLIAVVSVCVFLLVAFWLITLLNVT
jgi:magnesium transporter